MSWTKPNFPGYDDTWYRVEVKEIGYDQFVDKTSVMISPLKPFRNITVLVSGCTEASAVKCGNPRKITARTDVGGKDQPEQVFCLYSSIQFNNTFIKKGKGKGKK